jgi:streptogramin lyase
MLLVWGTARIERQNLRTPRLSKSRILVIDPSTDSVSTLAPAGPVPECKYYGSVLSPKGLIYGVPNKVEHMLAVLNPANGASFVVDTSSVATGPHKWRGCVFGPDGKIYAMPRNAGTVLVIDPLDNSVSGLNSSTVGMDNEKYFGGVLAANGKIYGVPYHADSILVIDTQTKLTPETGNYLSAYRNKY